MASQQGVYLDWNATTPLFDEVAETISSHLSCYGNPSSTHFAGRPAKATVDNARQQVAEMIGAEPGEIHFCSCGTEADNWCAIIVVRGSECTSTIM
jgi:cysteine desulfurase